MFQGKVDGERMCTDMLVVACKNPTPDTSSDDFCLDFCFFSNACGTKRQGKTMDIATEMKLKLEKGKKVGNFSLITGNTEKDFEELINGTEEREGKEKDEEKRDKEVNDKRKDVEEKSEKDENDDDESEENINKDEANEEEINEEDKDEEHEHDDAEDVEIIKPRARKPKTNVRKNLENDETEENARKNANPGKNVKTSEKLKKDGNIDKGRRRKESEEKEEESGEEVISYSSEELDLDEIIKKLKNQLNIEKQRQGRVSS